MLNRKYLIDRLERHPDWAKGPMTGKGSLWACGATFEEALRFALEIKMVRLALPAEILSALGLEGKS